MRKTILAIMALATCAGAAGQSGNLAPQSAYCLYSGTWIPMTSSTGAAAPESYPQVALYGQNGTSWYPLACDASGNLVITGAGGTPISLANGSTATTQAVFDNSTKIATTAYVDRAVLPPTLCNAATAVDYVSYVCSVTITTAQILAFNGTSTTAVLAISAPAAGRLIVPSLPQATANFITGASPYSATFTLLGTWGASGAHTVGLSLPILSTTLANSLAFGSNAGPVAVTSSDAAKGLYLYGDETVTGGNGSMVVTIVYRVIPMV
jgi:hypothetical protein